MPREKGMIFTAESIRGIKGRIKTQTRRLVHPQPVHAQYHEYGGKVLYDAEHRLWWWKEWCVENIWDFESDRRGLVRVGPHQVGDEIWVKEGWVESDPPSGYEYRADYLPGHAWGAIGPPKWKSPLFMPRRAARLFLEVTEVRVQPVNQISEADALAEGVECGSVESAAEKYGWLWTEIHGPESWKANPWVWVITFRTRPLHSGSHFV